MKQQQVFDLLSPLGLNQVSAIPVESLVFDDSVRKICESNGCGRYNKTWMCPPGVGPVADWEKKMKGFPNAVMFNYVGKIEDSFDFEGMQEVGRKFVEIVRAAKEAMDQTGEKFLLFGAGSCSLCEKCAFPDAPCRRPDDAVPSMEACGLFVAKMAEPNGFQYINGTNTVTYFGLILF